MEHDPESAMVELDKAVLQGHMAYPDILGRCVYVQSSLYETPTGCVNCVAVGPLGFVVEWADAFTGDGLTPIRGTEISQLSRVRRFYPWASASVQWDEWLHTDEQDEDWITGHPG